jgi:thiamine-phosphate pyrophosphorylase
VDPSDWPPDAAKALGFDEPYRSPESANRATDAAVLRILDVNANRAAEGLRVIEDHLRFAQDDRHLADLAKRLRHALVDTLSCLPASDLILARDAAGDVGRTLKTPQELDRGSVTAVVRANFKRTQQALRNLQEWTKLTHGPAALQFETLRYNVYELETILERTCQSDRQLREARLYVLIDGGENEANFVRRATSLIQAGVHMLQLRDKRLDDRQCIARGTRLMELVCGSSTRVVINDRPDLAIAVQAHGVHLGQEDMPVSLARRILGPTRLIGVSAHSIEQARSAVLQGASYLGLGPTFPSRTKAFEHFPGLELLRAVAAEIRLPAFAIGGIDLTRLHQVLACGVGRVAVSSAVWQATSPAEMCQQFLSHLADARPVDLPPDIAETTEGRS